MGRRRGKAWQAWQSWQSWQSLEGGAHPMLADPGWIEDGAGSGEARMAPGMAFVCAPAARPVCLSRVLTTAGRSGCGERLMARMVQPLPVLLLPLRVWCNACDA